MTESTTKHVEGIEMLDFGILSRGLIIKALISSPGINKRCIKAFILLWQASTQCLLVSCQHQRKTHYLLQDYWTGEGKIICLKGIYVHHQCSRSDFLSWMFSLLFTNNMLKTKLSNHTGGSALPLVHWGFYIMRTLAQASHTKLRSKIASNDKSATVTQSES